MKEKKILLIEGAQASRALASTYLAQAGFKVEEASSLREARLRLAGASLDLAIIDLDLDMRGTMSLVSELDSRGIPSIVHSEVAGSEHNILCLECGAQDVMTRPMNLRELHLRVARLWRMQATPPPPVLMEMVCGDSTLDVAKRQLRGPSQTRIPLTASEFRLLFLLLKDEGSVIARHTIARDVLGQTHDSSSRSVDVMVSKLRRKLELAQARRFIRSIRSEGYLLIAEERERPRRGDKAQDSLRPPFHRDSEKT